MRRLRCAFRARRCVCRVRTVCQREKAPLFLSGGCAVYEKNADMKLPIASTTKLMTAILALENCRGDECVYIRPEYCNVEGSSMYLAPVNAAR